MAKLNAENFLNLEIINDKKLQEMFKDFIPSVQNKIVMNGMKQAANVILTKAKSNFKSTRKNKSKTGYKNLNSSFKSQPMKKTFGLIVGVKNYKYGWIDKGTEDRYYKIKNISKKHNVFKHITGKIKPTDFFTKAVKENEPNSYKNISDAIITSLEKTVKKYANT